MVTVTIVAGDVRVRRADGLEGGGLLVEARHGVGAEQRERVATLQIVPELLEANGCLPMPLLPEHVHHLAVRSEPPLARERRGQAADDVPDLQLEEFAIGPAVSHEPGQYLAGVEERQLA